MKGNTSAEQFGNEVVLTKPLGCDRHCATRCSQPELIRHRLTRQLRKLNPAKQCFCRGLQPSWSA